MQKHLQGLNPEQLRAVEQTAGPVLVLAGAGSGKTRVITCRIAQLLAKKVPGKAILAMTFTNKAAAEMRERVGALVGTKRALDLTVGTFHAFCLTTLREHKELLGWPRGFTICDASDQLSAFKSVLRELRIPEARIQPSALQARVSLQKNKLVTPAGFLERAGSDTDELVGRAWQRYEELLLRTRRLDFDDLLTHTVRLFTENAHIKQAYEERFRYVLVDEYQDTNAPQYEIVRAIAGRHKNLCVVGDDDQSIYGWRGADVSKILGFERDFPDSVIVRLETNYRSTDEILSAANRLILNNPSRHEKTLRSAIGKGEHVQAVMMRDEDIEAQLVVEKIQDRMREEHLRFRDFAILFRTQTQPRPFEAELRMRQVPYVLVGGLSFFDRKEVRDVLAYLRLLANPDDETSLLRIINCPPRGVGKTTLERVLVFATEQGISVAEAFERGAEIEKINRNAVDVVNRLRERLTALGELEQELDLVALIERLIEEVAYRGEVERLYSEPRERDARWAGVMDVLNFAENFARKRKQPDLTGFLNHLTLTAGDDDSKDDAGKKDALTLMTLHASKGLEFPHVFLVGWEEGLLPHARSAAEDTIEEERRLAYVGITRAQATLTITHCAERARFGHRAQSHISRFLLEVKGAQPPSDWQPANAAEPGKTKKKKAKKRRRAARRR